MKRFILLLSCLAGTVLADDMPTLRFEKEVTWKQIFDSGFRPKYLVGRESEKCSCLKQKLWFQFDERLPKFKLGKGELIFEMPIAEDIHMLWHQGTEAITMQEGQLRADAFKKMFEGHIIQEMTMPRIIDPSGLVDAGNNENDIKARVGKYLFIYGFDNSYGKEKPIIPHFYIALNYPGKPDYRPKPRSYRIKPPEGYEWYSLDPKVNTPDPGGSPNATSEVDESAVKERTVPSEKLHPKLPEKPAKDIGSWIWKICLIAFVILGGFVLKRRLSNSAK